MAEWGDGEEMGRRGDLREGCGISTLTGIGLQGQLKMKEKKTLPLRFFSLQYINPV